ncbi:MAG: BspA family leucine-rich repeat surface protein [Proteobacteria bacterium]|nr:BspA family leucine-rich repeat surface protein [Pseudomonadota bacterium]
MRFLYHQTGALKCGLLAQILLMLLIMFSPQAALADLFDQFITTWKTDNPGSSNPTSITIPMVGGPYDVDWDGDGIFDEFGLTGPVTHDFGEAGIQTVTIEGSFETISFNNEGDKNKIITVNRWGTNAWTTMESAFYGCKNLEITADRGDFSQVTSMAYMFADALLVDPFTGNWDTGNVKSFRSMFDGASKAAPQTANWDTSSATDMFGMFGGATKANPETIFWDVSNVTDMGWMFWQAPAARPDTKSWDTSKVTNMSHMFDGASAANPDAGGWSTAEVKFMLSMFRNAVTFDQDIGPWNVGSLTDAEGMFEGVKLSTVNYNNLLTGWDAQNLNSGVKFSGGDSEFCSQEAIDARDNMLNSDGWEIADGGQCAAPQMTSLVIWSVGAVIENSETQLRVTAHFDDGSSEDVTTEAQWLENSPFASISSSGLFKALSVSSNQEVEIQVTYLWKTESTVLTILNRLSPPENTSASDKTSVDSVAISWDEVPDAEGYRVFRCTDENTASCGTAIAFPNNTSYTDADGELDTSYWYRVKSCADGKCGLFSTADEGSRGEGTNPHNLMRVHRLPSFDTDNKSDVLLRDLGGAGQAGSSLSLDGSSSLLGSIDTTGRWQMNFLNNRWVKSNSGPAWLFPSLDWEMMAAGDFNGNGRGDILLRNQITGGWWIFLMNGRNFTSGKTPITSDMDWLMAGVGDFDGDGKDDVILRNKVTGRWQIVFLNNRFVRANSGPVWLFPSLDWEIMGTGDFNGNGRSDIAMRNRLTGGWWIFLMNGKEFTGGKTLITTDPDWQIVAIDDFDGDGKDDLQLRNLVTGRWQINFMNHRQVKANSGPSWMFPSLEWELMGTGDFNGNGTGDNLLRNKTTGGWWIFLMNGRSFTSGKTPLTPNQDWVIPY